MYNFRIGESILFEAVMSLSVFCRKSSLKFIDNGKKWESEVKQKIGTDISRMISEDRNLLCWDKYMTILIMQSEYKNDFKKFIDWLNSMSAGDLFEVLSPFINDFTHEIGEQKKRYLEYFILWYENYFCDVIHQINEALHVENNKLHQLTKSLPIQDVIEQATKGLLISPESEVKSIILVPSIHISPINLSFKYNDDLYVIYYGVDLQKEIEEVPYDLTRMIKAISDDNRMKIIKYIKEEPKTFTEIMNFIGLSKATVFQHMTYLRTSSLISYRYLDQKFLLKRDAFALLKERMEHWVFES